MFVLIRLVLVIIASVLTLCAIRKARVKHKRMLAILLVVVYIAIATISTMFPAENLFVTFQTPEDVFHYTTAGKIYDIIPGEESSLIVYKKTEQVHGCYIVPKEDDGYKIPGYFSSQIISQQMAESSHFEVFQVSNTADYYVYSFIALEQSNCQVQIFNGDNEQIHSKVVMVDDSGFIYFYLPDYTNGCYLLVDGKKIMIADS